MWDFAVESWASVQLVVGTVGGKLSLAFIPPDGPNDHADEFWLIGLGYDPFP
jgi:hypothetical protein